MIWGFKSIPRASALFPQSYTVDRNSNRTMFVFLFLFVLNCFMGPGRVGVPWDLGEPIRIDIFSFGVLERFEKFDCLCRLLWDINRYLVHKLNSWTPTSNSKGYFHSERLILMILDQFGCLGSFCLDLTESDLISPYLTWSDFL